jgi:hypothetical protein
MLQNFIHAETAVAGKSRVSLSGWFKSTHLSAMTGDYVGLVEVSAGQSF